MLEQDVLILPAGDRGEALTGSPAGRAIVAPGGRPLGRARWVRPGTGRGWGWWRRAVLEVREHEDEPLVFTLRRCWTLAPWYEVRDADERTVGYLIGPLVQDRYLNKLALRRREGADSQFVGVGRCCLARVRPGPEGTQVQFGPR